jgi:hypothetical protein
MSENQTTDNNDYLHIKSAKPKGQNPAMLVKTPKLPIKIEFAEDQKIKIDPKNEK